MPSSIGVRLLVVLVLCAPVLLPSGAPAAHAGDAPPPAVAAEDEAVRLELIAVGGDVERARALVLQHGGTVEVVSGGRVQALVPSSAVRAIEARRDLVRVDSPGIFLPLQTASALELIDAPTWNAAGFSGFGSKVAILDAGFQAYQSALGSTLPPAVTAISFRADGQLSAATSHGRRAAEIVFSMAPGASLYLLNFSTVTELSSAVDYLIAEDVDVVSFSLGYVHNGPGDGAGPVNEIVSRAAEAGIAWSVASGNWAQQHWAGAFRDTDGDGFHEFEGAAEMNEHAFMAGDLITASLRWDEPWGAACSDYDLEVFGPSGALLRAARGIQACEQDPVESLQVLATQTGAYSIRVIQAAAEAPRHIELMVVGSPDRGLPLAFSVPAGSLSEPADNASVITVGALTPGPDRTEAPYSSRGPTADGRFKPNILGPTGSGNASPAATFGGTSAAAPHVAGALALLQEAHPGADAARLAMLVQSRAVPLAPVPGGSGAMRVDLGSLAGLGPVLPAGGLDARFLGDIPDGGGLALVQYDGPDGYPARFTHLLLDYRAPLAVYSLDIASQEWSAYVTGAPAFVNAAFNRYDDGQLLVLRLP
ncbi:MAG: S8 family serine peptidase [Dehalococcoidia bacterium]